MNTPQTDLRSLARYSGDPWLPQNRYFQQAEGQIERLWENRIWPLIKGLDFGHVADLAAGHGRNSEKLREHARKITILDIQPGNVEVCRQRFAGDPRFSFFVNSGYDFRPLEASSVSLIYCFDSMVHFDSDVVRSYLADARRVLVPGGHGFFHHSNYTGGHDWKTNPYSRNFMSRELFAHYALKEKLQVVTQQVIRWGQTDDLDCLTVVRRD